jgi:hypothetical protein
MLVPISWHHSLTGEYCAYLPTPAFVHQRNGMGAIICPRTSNGGFVRATLAPYNCKLTNNRSCCHMVATEVGLLITDWCTKHNGNQWEEGAQLFSWSDCLQGGVLAEMGAKVDGEGVGGWTWKNRMIIRGTEERTSKFSVAKQWARGNPELSKSKEYNNWGHSYILLKGSCDYDVTNKGWQRRKDKNRTWSGLWENIVPKGET